MIRVDATAYAQAAIAVRRGSLDQQTALGLLIATAPYNAERLEFTSAAVTSTNHSAACVMALTLLLYNDRCEDAARLLLPGDGPMGALIRSSGAEILSHANGLAEAILRSDWAPPGPVLDLALWMYDQRAQSAAETLFMSAMASGTWTVKAFLAAEQRGCTDVLLSPHVVGRIGPEMALAALLLGRKPYSSALANHITLQYGVDVADALTALLRHRQYGPAARVVSNLGLGPGDLPHYSLEGDGRDLLAVMQDVRLADAVAILVLGAASVGEDVAGALLHLNSPPINAAFSQRRSGLVASRSHSSSDH